MARLTGYRCDHCGRVVDDHAADGLPIGWFQVRHKAHACVDDFLPVGDFCSERCLVQRCMKIEHPAPPREEA